MTKEEGVMNFRGRRGNVVEGGGDKRSGNDVIILLINEFSKIKIFK